MRFRVLIPKMPSTLFSMGVSTAKAQRGGAATKLIEPQRTQRRRRSRMQGALSDLVLLSLRSLSSLRSKNLPKIERFSAFALQRHSPAEPQPKGNFNAEALRKKMYAGRENFRSLQCRGAEVYVPFRDLRVPAPLRDTLQPIHVACDTAPENDLHEVQKVSKPQADPPNQLVVPYFHRSEYTRGEWRYEALESSVVRMVAICGKG
jgi:hypothetical protein